MKREGVMQTEGEKTMIVSIGWQRSCQNVFATRVESLNSEYYLFYMMG